MTILTLALTLSTILLVIVNLGAVVDDGSPF